MPIEPSERAREAAAAYVAVAFGPQYYVSVMKKRGFPDLVQAFARFEAETRKDERERVFDLIRTGP